MPRLKVYNLATGQWEYVNFPLHRHGPMSSGSGANTPSGHGTATMSTNICEWEVWGSLCVFRCQISWTTAGSGATNINFQTPAPPPYATTTLMGDRGGTGISRLFARASNSGGFLNLGNIATLANVIVTGADIAAGSSYSFAGAYPITQPPTSPGTSDPILV